MPQGIEISYVVYDSTDLEQTEAFMQDFGLVTAERTKSSGTSCCSMRMVPMER